MNSRYFLNIALLLFMTSVISCRASFKNTEEQARLASTIDQVSDITRPDTAIDTGTKDDDDTKGDDSQSDGPKLTIRTPLEPGDDKNCPEGGVKITIGIDDNRNGELEDDEIDEIQYECVGDETPEDDDDKDDNDKCCCCCCNKSGHSNDCKQSTHSVSTQHHQDPVSNDCCCCSQSGHSTNTDSSGHSCNKSECCSCQSCCASCDSGSCKSGSCTSNCSDHSCSSQNPNTSCCCVNSGHSAATKHSQPETCCCCCCSKETSNGCSSQSHHSSSHHDDGKDQDSCSCCCK